MTKPNCLSVCISTITDFAGTRFIALLQFHNIKTENHKLEVWRPTLTNVYSELHQAFEQTQKTFTMIVVMLLIILKNPLLAILFSELI